MRRFFFCLLLAAPFQAGCGSSLECGEGTFRFDGACVPFDPDDQTAPVTAAFPEGGAFRELPAQVLLTTDKPATIYYTTDGSAPTTASSSRPNAAVVTPEDGVPVRFFAVDLGGNQESPRSETYVIDLEAPGPVEGFRADLEGEDVALTWTNPEDEDLAGVLVARRLASPSFDGNPADGAFYSAGDVLPGGAEVVFAGSGEEASDVIEVVGQAFYAAWAFDGVGNYSRRRLSQGLATPLPAQTATLSVNLASEEVTITQPASFTLAATASYDDEGGTVLIDLTATNDTQRIVHNLRAETTAVNEGSQVGDSFGGVPFVHFGPYGLAVAAESETRTIEVTGVTGAVDPLTVELELYDHPILVGRRDIIDGSGAISSSTRLNDNNSLSRHALVDKTGRLVFHTIKHRAQLTVNDLTVPDASFLITLAASGSTAGLAAAGDKIYAGLNRGMHWYGSDRDENGPGSGSGSVEIVELHASSLLEIRRLVLIPDAEGAAVRGVFASPDESRLAVLVTQMKEETNEVWFVDVEELTPIDTDPDTAGIQPVQLGTYGDVEHGAWSEASDRFYAGFRNINMTFGDDSSAPPIEVVDLSSFAIDPLTPTEGGRFAAGMVERGGKLYYVSGNRGSSGPLPLTVFDLAGDSQSNPDPGFDPEGGGVLFHPAGDLYYVAQSKRSSCTVVAFDVTDDTLIDLDGLGMTTIDLCVSPHGNFVITPF